ncbi:MAG: hypothetical protein JXR95_03905 [Deltaproteobacteria bacterium]|nr:hypothetical protein [Deltaproteobacteria bacterium]
MNKIISFVYVLVLGTIAAFLSIESTREQFVLMTRNYPFLMGFLKIGILGTMGELLSGRVVTGTWKISGVSIHQRFLIWGFFGLAFTVVFPMFSMGVEGLLRASLLPGKNSTFLTAFWKSFFMNIIFAPPMMTFHRLTDTLIDRKMLFKKWPAVEIFQNMNWANMIRVVGFSCIWFWIPAHTATFLLPPEFRVLSAALLSLALGLILGYAKRKSLQ